MHCSSSKIAMLLITALCIALGDARGTERSDWPQWRYDAGRHGTAPDALAETLHLPARDDLHAMLDLVPLDDSIHPPLICGLEARLEKVTSQ